MVMNRMQNQMREAFHQGNVIDAQNMNVWLRSLETLTDAQYEALVDDAEYTDRERIGLG